MAAKTGRSAIIEQFLADGMDFMFGNPGTVEQGFLDALADYPEMKYILTLQESVAVLTGDGYARATQKTDAGAVAQHARRRQRHRRALPGQARPFAAGGDRRRRGRPVHEHGRADGRRPGGLRRAGDQVVDHGDGPASLLRVCAGPSRSPATPPMGPVYVCLPADILDAPLHRRSLPDPDPLDPRARRRLDLSTRPPTLLAAGAKPMIFVGDGVAYSGAQAELERVAELLGAEVWEADSGEVNMSYDHPLYQGMTGHMFGSASLPIMQRGDANLIVGTYVLPEVFPELGDIWRRGAKVIHIDLNAYEIAKNHRVDLGVVADPKLTLALLADALEAGHDRRAEARRPTPHAGDRRGQGSQADGAAPGRPGGARRDAAAHGAFHGRAGQAAAHEDVDHLRRGADQLAGRGALLAAPAHRRVLPDPRRLAGRRLPRRNRRQAGQSRQDRDRLHRRRRLRCTRSRRCGRRRATTSTPSSSSATTAPTGCCSSTSTSTGRSGAFPSTTSR